MAAITDLLDRVSDSTTGRPVVTSLASPGKALAAASITLADATNWTTTTAIHFVIYKVNANGIKDPTSQTEWKGVLTGSTVSNLTITGGTDQAYNTGDVVELAPTSRYAKDLYDWGTTHADQDGTLKAGAVDVAAVLADNVVEAAKIKDSNVTAAKLATNAITLGHAERTSDFVTSSVTPVQVTSLSSTVTIPSGSRRVEIEVYGSNAYQTGSGGAFELGIWDGTVNSGTQLNKARLNNAANANSVITCKANIASPAAGSKTYNVSIKSGSGQATLEGGATSPMFLSVKVF